MSDADLEPVEHAPHLRVVRGDPSPEEVAALVAVVSALTAAGGTGDGRVTRPVWSAPQRSHRAPLAPGRGGWRSSALPR